ncbi:hypothetical protein K7H91_24390 [Martelella mediterranea]|uniref:Bug family tripartite tricarboxylate transporter substrate binding protein n=1 Tax=Martelella mediterranea TaxID=293089 RepID=UPI001E510013|nr:tripartite tricarboxylate transporter substrate-binding protein [Martelella mediterranea]MCD1636895.1 hypothetical protein [Martelella mediterranea]
MRLFENALALGLAVATTFGTMQTAIAETPAEFYEGKTVTIVVSAAAGTASDTIGRLFVEHLAKHFPGNPDFVVVNKAGAGGLKAASELMLTEETDGTVISLLQRNNLYIPLILEKENQFDPREVRWVGSINGEEYPNNILAMDTSPVQSAEDIFAKKMVIGSTSYTHENRSIPAMMNKYLGAQFEVVPGYKGRGEVYLAMERGEVDGWMQGFNTLRTASGGGDWVKAGRAKPIIVIGTERQSEWPDVPAISEFVKDDDQRAVLNFFLAPLRAGRPFAVPGDVPEDRVEAIRQAFADTFEDPEALEILNTNLEANTTLISGAEMEDLVGEIYSASDEVLEAARDILVQK